MRIIELITEKRSNPDLNPKISVIDAIKKHQSNADALPNNMSNLFISMTSIDKLGINPNIKYNTPVGIYSYPGDYVIKTATNTLSQLPFAGEQPFVNIFNIADQDNIIYLNSVTPAEYRGYISKLKIAVGDDIFEYAQRRALSSGISTQHLGKVIWETTRRAAERFPKSPIVWNSIFRKMGIAGCVDTGEGIIHPAERTQAVFFSIKAINVLDRVRNNFDKTRESAGQKKQLQIEELKRMTSSERVELLINGINQDTGEIELLKFLPKREQHAVLKEVSAASVFAFISQFLKKPAPEFTQYLENDPDTALRYMYEFDIHSPWPEIEDKIANDAHRAFTYSTTINSRFPAGEAAISKDTNYSKWYNEWFGTTLSQQ